jgi:hypothetical protein
MKTIFIVCALNGSKWFSCHLQKWVANEMQRSHETKWITCDSVFNFFAIKDFHTTTLTKCDRLAKSPQVDKFYFFYINKHQNYYNRLSWKVSDICLASKKNLFMGTNTRQIKIIFKSIMKKVFFINKNFMNDFICNNILYTCM